ncbi:MAG TPA: hypothetical protein VNU01_01120, partial [Egibacteraceae bacterium]|nr:hypothetical protein [Egibacteraceae bacterium]
MSSRTDPPQTLSPPALQARAVGHGPALAEAVAHTVAGLQDGDPLRGVTVLVPTRSAGVALRRQVAGRLGGMAAVRFELAARAAELLAAPELAAAGKRPLRPAVLTEAVRAVLHQAPGRFAPVADHPATARALARTVRDLGSVPAGALAGLSRARGREAARVAGAVRALLHDRYDEHDLLRTAASLAAERPAAAAELGAVVAIVDRALSPAATAFLRAVAGQGPVTVLVALTGDERADAGALQAADALGCELGRAPQPAVADAAPDGTVRVLSAPDPETEVRAAVRRIAERFDAGAPLHRMALLWTADRPYALLVRDALAAAGLPSNGGPRTRLGDSPTGRALLGMLALASGGPRPLAREAVAAWLAEAPLRREAGGAPVDGARWDAVSRRAGVVAGAGQWRARLERYAATVERRADDEVRDGASDAVRRAAAAEAAHARALAGFVEELAQRLRAPAGGQWSAFARWARELLDRYVGEPRAGWGDDAVEADRRVRAALDGLAELDGVGASADLGAFRRAVEAELDGRLGRRGRLGEGLLTGPLREGLCQELDLVVVVGLVEGLAPPSVRDDPVLPDRERAAVPGLPLRGDQPAERRRELLAALAAAPERLLCAARSDNRAGRAPPRAPGRAAP